MHAMARRTHGKKKVDLSRMNTLIKLALKICAAGAHGASYAIGHKILSGF